MNPTRVIPLIAAAGVFATAAPASASELLNSRVAADRAANVSCLEDSRGASVVRREVTASVTGLVRASLSGAADSDWDVSIFNRETGRRIAGSANFGSTELAEGVVRAGTPLLVQACRMKGDASSVDLRVLDIALDEPKGAFLKLARVELPHQHARDIFAMLDLDSTEHGKPNEFMDVLLHGPQDIAALERSNLGYKILVDDVVAADRAAIAAYEKGAEAEPEPLPSGRVTYRTYEDYGAEMKRLVDENPTLAKPVTMRYPSLEGRPIQGIEITKDVNGADGKPVFYMTGVHHAREWPSGEMSMEWAFEAIVKYKAEDPRMQKLLENVRLVIVPLINPDGFNLSRASTVDSQQPIVDPAFAYKRKNCRVKDFETPKPGECGQQSNRSLGVDPNRNYGGDWGGPGAATDFANDTYRGPTPFSEPETQNLKDFMSTRQVQTFITNHTYSDLILRPPAAAEDKDTPDEAAYKAFSDNMAKTNGYASLKSYELYDTSGSAEGWSYWATGGYGFTFEIGRAGNAGDPVNAGALVGVGFHPAYPVVIAEWNGKYGGGGNREAYYIAGEHTADVKNHSVIEGSGPAGATVRLAKEFITVTKGGDPLDESPIRRVDNLNTTTTIPSTGTFNYHINQSTRPRAVEQGTTETWTLTCEQDGKVIGKSQVSVLRGEKKALGNVCSGGGGSSNTVAPPVGTEQLGLTIKAGKLSVRKLAKGGVTVSVTCSKACDLSATLGITKKTAKQLKLGKKALVLAKARKPGASGTTTLRFKASKSVAKKLRKVKKLSATLRVTGKSGSVTRTATAGLRFTK